MRKLLLKVILDLMKCPNQKMHESESAGYLVGHFPWSRISEVVYNYGSHFFGEHFGQYLKTKMDFPLYFQKVIWPGADSFCSKKILKKPNTSEYALVLVVTWAKLNSVPALLFPHRNQCGYKYLQGGCKYLLPPTYE